MRERNGKIFLHISCLHSVLNKVRQVLNMSEKNKYDVNRWSEREREHVKVVGPEQSETEYLRHYDGMSSPPRCLMVSVLAFHNAIPGSVPGRILANCTCIRHRAIMIGWRAPSHSLTKTCSVVWRTQKAIVFEWRYSLCKNGSYTALGW